MRSSTWRLEDLRNVILNLGFVGENLHTRKIFDCKKTFDQYPNASVSMTVTPPEGEPYPGTIERDGDLVIWDVRDSDLVAEGDGEIQLVFTQEPHIARSYNARTHICRSQVPTGSIPSGLDDYITRADQLLDQVEDTFPAGGTTGQVLAKKSDTDYDTEWVDQGGGTEDYDELENRPQIGGVTLTGNKTLHDLGAASEADVEAKYTKPETGIPASDLAAGVIPDPEDLIDDEAGAGDTDKVWSADKSHELLTDLTQSDLEIKQIEKLNFDLLEGATWEMGAFNPSSDDVASNNKIRTGYISVDGMNRVILGCDADYRFYGLMYDSSKNVVSGSEFGWTTNSKLIKDLANDFPTAKYVRLCFQKTDETADVTIASHMRGIYYNAFVDYVYRSYLLSDIVYGTTQAVTKDSSGRVTQITHSSGGNVIRTDTITYGNGTITETRTGFDLTVTITTNLTTLAVEVA